MKHILIIIFLAFFSIPSGAQWISANFPSDGPILAFGVHDTSFFISVVPGQNGDPFFYRHASPDDWIVDTTGLSTNITFFASLGNYFFLSTPSSRVKCSTNYGATWSNVNAGGPIGTNGKYLFGQIYPVTGPYLIRSIDSGKTWDSITKFTTTKLVGDGSRVLASTSTGMYRSTDSGGTWTSVTTPISNISCFAVVGTAIYAANGTKLMVSTDSGAQWDALSTGFSVSCLATNGKRLFAGGLNGVYLLGTDGMTWIYESDTVGLKGQGVVALGVFDTLLFADFDVNGSYILDFRSIPGMTDSTASVVQATQPGDTLSIYPNPASDEVTIISGGTSIYGVSVLNVLGENVMEESNMHENEITLDVSKLPSGTYFFRIQTSQGTKLRKVVINRGA